MKAFILTTTILLSNAPVALACSMNGGPWHAVDAELVESTKQIVIAEVAKMTPVESNMYDHELKVLRVLKGPKIKSLEFKKLPQDMSRKKIDDSADGDEIPDGFRRRPEAQQEHSTSALPRASYGADCALNISGFSKGRKYLIFVDSFHPKGYEQISGENDPWLREVEELIAQPPKKVRFEKQNVDVFAVSKGLFTEWRFRPGFIALGRIPWKNALTAHNVKSSTQNSFCFKLDSNLEATFEKHMNTVTRAVVRKASNKSDCTQLLPGKEIDIVKYIGGPIADLKAVIGPPAKIEGPNHFWAEIRDHRDGYISITTLVAHLSNGVIESLEFSNVKTQ